MEQDSLTHVKNRTAYDKYVKNFKKRFNDGEIKEYAVAYFDINNLKVVNDKYGHEAGDAYIRNSCKLICDTFKHSPVFRIGGDEFLSILYNDDFKNRDALLVEMKKEMAMRESMPEKYSPAARVSVASGLAVFDATIDADLMSVVNRADTLMYEDKYKMKKGEIR
jgi:diguanylate cyclase (GGDEF)-like protein